MKTVREKIEEAEFLTLSESAQKSAETKGRKVYEEHCELRTEYQRDRDRIIHSKSFRNLKHKTQVFISPESDHYRTRLTHTLEVSQIARTIARALRLNEDLTEAIALGHDLGHTPFGHAGERALNDSYSGGFTHYKQSVRVCEKLEKDGKGLNLTAEVLDGIGAHTSGEEAKTAEGRIVRISDRIAYINHDIDDATLGSIIKETDIPSDIRDFLGHTKTERIDTLVKSVVLSSEGKNIKMDEETKYYYDKLHDFLYTNVYRSDITKAEDEKAYCLIKELYKSLLENFSRVPEEFRKTAEDGTKERAVCDYIASMTDRVAVSCYEEIFVPKFWKL